MRYYINNDSMIIMESKREITLKLHLVEYGQPNIGVSIKTPKKIEGYEALQYTGEPDETFVTDVYQYEGKFIWGSKEYIDSQDEQILGVSWYIDDQDDTE